MIKLMLIFLDLNPTNVAALGTKFMATVSEACEKFIQGVFKSFSK